jgi:hypothetical protein
MIALNSLSQAFSLLVPFTVRWPQQVSENFSNRLEKKLERPLLRRWLRELLPDMKLHESEGHSRERGEG